MASLAPKPSLLRQEAIMIRLAKFRFSSASPSDVTPEWVRMVHLDQKWARTASCQHVSLIMEIVVAKPEQYDAAAAAVAAAAVGVAADTAEAET